MSAFSSRPDPRRLAGWLVAAGLLTSAMGPAAVTMAPPAAVAQRPGGGYHDSSSYGGSSKEAGNGLEGLWSTMRTPLRWLRRSSRSFQSLMRVLAERSALQAGDELPPSLRPKRPPKPPVEVADDPPRRSVYGGEAGAGPN